MEVMEVKIQCLFLLRFNVHLPLVIVRYLISKLFFKWKEWISYTSPQK